MLLLTSILVVSPVMPDMALPRTPTHSSIHSNVSSDFLAPFRQYMYTERHSSSVASLPDPGAGHEARNRGGGVEGEV